MKNLSKRILSLLLAFSIVFPVFGNLANVSANNLDVETTAISENKETTTEQVEKDSTKAEEKTNDPNQNIKQVNAHVGADAATEKNLSWVTVENTDVKVTVKDENGKEVFTETVKGTSNEKVYTYTSEVKGLKASSKYTYTLENLSNIVEGEFRTAAPKGTEGKVRFAMLADPQIADATRAEATGAIFKQLSDYSKESPFDFLYIAGDHTDRGADEDQWQALFHNGGLFPNATQDFLLKNTLHSTQGNHDAIDFKGHINTPDEIGEEEFQKGVYSVDYGKVRFININNASYNVKELATNPAFKSMLEFLKKEVKEAKDNGMWTVLGFHKPLYTGASHVDDGDVVEYRKILNPIISELDIDFVLNGHDHVYSRGFVNKDGYNATELDKEKTAENGGVTTFKHVNNAPLHLVSEHSGGLKWYRPVDYTVAEGDPIAPNYEFLDKNSATETPASQDEKEQTYMVIEIDDNQAHFVAYKMKYENGQMVKEPRIYDEFYVTKAVDEKPEKTNDPNQNIKQVNAHVGADAVTEKNLSWVTVENTDVKVTVKDENGKEVFTETVKGTSNEKVYTYTSEVKGLKASSKYTYTLENLSNIVEGEFRTAAPKGTEGKVRFAMLADPQIADATRAEATGAIFKQLSDYSKESPFDFLYIAGDHTDRGADEDQWQALFHNGGLFPNATQDFLLKNTLHSTQGNHDAIDFKGHINTPDEIGEEEFQKGVYSVDYGKVRFININNASYNVKELATNPAFKSMLEFLKKEVKEAKDNGMWTVLGFHKPLYTGASHVDDGDVVEYRKILNPIISELDIDFVLNGHDHVYSRGFVNKDGYNATELDKEKTAENGGVTTFKHVNNAPLHLVSEHSGGLKWYRPVDYTVAEGDPIAPNYEFLDKNSATETPASQDEKEQTYMVIEIDDNQAHFVAYKMKYENGQMVKEPRIYDEFYVTKAVEEKPEDTKFGWVRNGDNWNYYDKDGSQVKSAWRWAPLLDEDGNPTTKYNWKYFDSKGNSINQIYTENGSSWLSVAGPSLQYHRGWWLNRENNEEYYFRKNSGSMVKGRQFIDNNWMFFRNSGTLALGWQFFDGHWNFADRMTGYLAISEWKWAPIIDKEGKETGKYNWKYFNSRGYSIDQIYTENGLSWLSVTGPMRQYHKGWWTNPSNGYTYFFRLTTGTMAKGEQFINGTWRFFRKSGTMATGWQLVNGTWKFYRIGTGTRVSGRQFIDGRWREFAKDGSLIK